MNKSNHAFLNIFSTLSSARFKTADRLSEMATKVMTFNDKHLYFVQRYTNKQFSLGYVLKQRGDGMKRFGDMKGNYELFNKFYV